VTSGAAAAYEVSLADLDRDGAEITGLCSSVLDGFTPFRYEKYFERNPLGPPLVATARAANGELVGVAALHPQQLNVDGEIVSAGVAGDFVVHPEHRTFGPALALQRELTRAADERGLGLAIGMCGDDVAGVLRRVGYRPAGSFVRLVRMLGLTGRAGELARRTEPPGAFVRAMRTRPLKDALRGHSVVEPESFDARLEPLLTAAAPAGVSLQRSQRFLDWRFVLDGAPGEGNPFLILAVLRDGAPVAYAVARDYRGVRRVADLAWLDPAGLAAVLAAVVEQARDAGLGAVELPYFGGSADLAGTLARFGFFPGRWPGHDVWYRGEAPAGAERWHLFASAFDV
jgi:Acetyltransferase (GNAT) domain